MRGRPGRMLGIVLRWSSVGLLALAVVIAVSPRVGDAPALRVTGAVLAALLALLAFLGSGDPARFASLIRVLILGTALVTVGSLVLLLRGQMDPSVAAPISVLGGVFTVVTGVMLVACEKQALGLLYYTPAEFRSLVALAEVLIMGEDEILTPERVGHNVDQYLSAFNAQSKWLSRVVFIGIEYYPVLTGHPPLSWMNADDRLAFLRRRFYRDVSAGALPRVIKVYLRAMIRMAAQLVYLGYYNDRRTYASVGYVPFSERPDAASRLAESPLEPPPPLEVIRPSQLQTDHIEADVMITGSGAAAAVLAYRLAEAGRSVVLLEKGNYVSPTEFGEDEVAAFSRLFSDGALQMTRDFSYQVMQGSCVGGSTVVNNAVCFDLPPEVLASWTDPATIDTGLDQASLTQAFVSVRALVGVYSQNGRPLNPSLPLFLQGLGQLGITAPPHRIETVEANIRGCVGCGYCNLGCRFGKKLSMLVTLLPRAQAAFGRDRVRILPNCEVQELRHSGGQVTEAVAKLVSGRRIRVTANTYVISAGAISSSILLLRSRLGGPTTGRRLSFNMASPIFGLFDDPIHAYDGLQISTYCLQAPATGYMLETFAAPPAFTALTMPGWFDDHYRNMRAYSRMMTTGALVGMEATGRVTRGGLMLGRTIDYTVNPTDLQRMVEGLITAGKLMFAAGASKVMPSTFTYREFHTAADLDGLRGTVGEPGELAMGGGHPQGGNPMSRNPQGGTVGPDFRVHGTTNLFLCDASVFPTSVGVNPQLTVMALAEYAAPIIARHQADQGG